MRFSLADTQQAEDVAAFIAAAQGPYAGVILNVSIKILCQSVQPLH
jgi:hypothetical protein